MDSLGQLLRSAREQQKKEIAEIAVELRISARYLEAIEAERFDDLPGGFFSRAFILQYASHLGIEEDQIRGPMDGALGGEASPPVPGEEPRKEDYDLAPLPRYARNRGQHRTIISGIAALVVVVVACALIYNYWLSGEDEPTAAVLVDEPPSSPVLAAEKPPPPPEPATIEPVEPVAPPPKPVPDGPLYVQIEADEEVWVEITSRGSKLFSGVLRPKDTKELSGLQEAQVMIGNAGGLRIYANGKSIGPIGPRGHVRRVKLTPTSAEITNPRAKRPTPDDESASATTAGTPSA